MFLFERLFGVGVYSLILVAVCFYIKGLTDYKKIKRAFIIYASLLAVMGFFYVPYKTADLYRIYEYVDLFKSYSFAELWSKEPWNSEIGVGAFYYWTIGKTGVPELLPAINTLACYGCIFYIIYNYAQNNNISGKNIAITLFFYMSIGNYMFVITGIRCMLGISLLAFCFYRENIEGKFSVLHIPLYVIAIFVHTFAVVLVALRFIVQIFDSKIGLIKRAASGALVSIGGIIAITHFGGYISRIFEKAESYLSGDLYSYVWEYVIAFLTVVISSAALISFIKHKNGIENVLNLWFIYASILIAIAACICFEFTIFHRLTTYIIPIVVLPILMTTLQEAENRNDETMQKKGTALIDRPISLAVCVVGISIITLLVVCSRGSLSSLKFFVL